MASAERDAMLNEVKKNLRSVLMCTKGGVDENFVLKEYKEFIGEPLPYRKLGYSTLFDMAKGMPDVVQINRQTDGSYKYCAVADETTKHIQKMVAAQKTSRKKSKKGKTYNMRKPVRQSTWVKNVSHKSTSIFSHRPTPPQPPSTFGRPPQQHANRSTAYTPLAKASSAWTNYDHLRLINSNTKEKPKQAPDWPKKLAPEPKIRSVVMVPSVKPEKENQSSFSRTFQRDLPPRFQQNQPQTERTTSPPVSTKSKPQATLTEPIKARTATRKHTNRAKTSETNYIELVEGYLRGNNIDAVYDTITIGTKSNKGYVSSIKIQGEVYGCFGIFSTKERAELFAAKTAWENISAEENANDNLSATPITEEEVKRKVAMLIKGRHNGVWQQRVPMEYREKYREAPPLDLLDRLDSWTDILTVEQPRNLEKKIVYPTLGLEEFLNRPVSQAAPLAQAMPALQMSSQSQHVPNPVLPAVGSTVGVLPCFIIDCDMFFVHIQHQTQINSIMEKLDNIYVRKVDGEPPSFKDSKRKLEKGSYCAALYEGLWYRAQALTNPVPNRNFEDSIDIFYIDFGNTENVTVSSLRLLRKSLYNMPVQAIRCKLHGIGKKSDDDWENATKQLRMIEAQGTAVTMTVIEHADETCSVKLYNNSQQSINELLIKSRLVRDSTIVKATDPEELLIPEVPDGENLEVFVSHIYNPDNVVIRLLCYSDDLTNLETKIKESNLPTGLDDLAVGDLCAAYDPQSLEEGSQDNPWYRVRILKLLGNRHAQIEYLDYSNTAEMDLKNLRLLRPEENKLPYQSVRAQLTGLEGVKEAASTGLLKRMAENTACLAEINSRDPFSITLWDTSTADDVNINELICQILMEDQLTPKLPAEMGDAECFVAHVTPSGTVFLQLRGPGIQNLSQLISKATEVINNTPKEDLQLKDIQVGEVCLALYAEDNNWYRARITEVTDDIVNVFFIDYGNDAEVHTSDLINLTETNARLFHLPAQALEVRIDGTPPECGWTEKALTRLEELVYNQKLYVETIKQGGENELPSVELHIFQNDELHSVQEILRQEASIWQSSDSDVNDLIEKLQLDSENMDNNNTYKQSDILNNAPPASADNYSPPLPAQSYSPPPPAESCKLPVSTEDEVSPHPGDYEGPGPQLQRRVPQSGDQIYITSVANPSNFQFINEEDKQIREDLMEEMGEYYAVKFSEGSDVGEVAAGDVLAAYSQDNCRFYRVQVKNQLPNDMFAVNLIDYGEYSVVQREHLLQLLPEFSQHTPFAVKATLIGVAPTDGDVWSAEAVKRFEELALDKTLTVWAPGRVAVLGERLALTLLSEKQQGKDEVFIHKILLDEGLAVNSALRRSSLEGLSKS